MSDLDRLIEAVEAGHKMDTVISARGCLDLHQRRHLLKAADGSLDAAKALHEALLPGWDSRLELRRQSKAWVSQPMAVTWWNPASSDIPARAWLLAILKAHRAQVQP